VSPRIFLKPKSVDYSSILDGRDVVQAEAELLLVESRGRSSDINSTESRKRKNRTPNISTKSLSGITRAFLESVIVSVADSRKSDTARKDQSSCEILRLSVLFNNFAQKPDLQFQKPDCVVDCE
jgi:hypothetical protein